MSVLDGIQEKMHRRQYELSRHAVDQSIVRRISIAEVEEALLHAAEIIESYPQDKYGPSCLILGFTASGRALHLQCSHPDRDLIKIITLYDPDPGRGRRN